MVVEVEVEVVGGGGGGGGGGGRGVPLLLDHRQQPVRQPRLRPPLDRAGHALPARLDAIETLLQRFDVSVAHRFELGHFDVEVAAEGSVLGRRVVDLWREVVVVVVEEAVEVVVEVGGGGWWTMVYEGGQGGWWMVDGGREVDGGGRRPASPSAALSSSLARPRAAAPRPPSRRRRRPPPPSPPPCLGTRRLEHPSPRRHPRAAAERLWLGAALPPRPEDAGDGGMRG